MAFESSRSDTVRQSYTCSRKITSGKVNANSIDILSYETPHINYYGLMGIVWAHLGATGLAWKFLDDLGVPSRWLLN